ncbi:MAG: amino acid permease [Aeriscardovia sp.]|nr:amino acid permease [Aeriscardovia sp.]
MASKEKLKNKVGAGALTALVVGGTIGSGIFGLPSTMTKNGNPKAIIIGWIIVGIGMFALAGVYRDLTMQQPEIDDGIYGWAKGIFGDLGGFFANYGHGVGDAVGDTSYLVVIFSALGSFGVFGFFGDGTTWWSVLVASILLWLLTWLVLRGVKSSTLMNDITTIAKIIPIVVFIVLAILNFNPHIFMAHWASTSVYVPASHTTAAHWTHESVFAQSKAVLLSAMWCLVGIESGTIYATRARKTSDVAKATTIGSIIVIIVLVGTAVLSLGLMAPSRISQLHDPSMAGLMAHMTGPWGSWLINICLIVSVVGALLAWISLCSEELRLPSRGGSATKWLNQLNGEEIPKNAVLTTSCITEALLLVAGFSSAGYETMLEFATSLDCVPYLMVSLYACKSVIKGIGFRNRSRGERVRTGVLAALSTLFTAFMVYGAGLQYLLLTAVVWLTGFWFYWKGRQEQGKRMGAGEWSAWIVVAVLAVLGIIGLCTRTMGF